MAIEQDIYVAADIMVVYNNRSILLIKRKFDPHAGTWALPGGFVETEEPLIDAAQRELEEETGLKVDIASFHFRGVYAKPGRDSRFRTLSVVYRVDVSDKAYVMGQDDASEAAWFERDNLPELAFDHGEILEDHL